MPNWYKLQIGRGEKMWVLDDSMRNCPIPEPQETFL